VLAGVAATYAAMRAAAVRRAGAADRSDPAPTVPAGDRVAQLVEALPFAAFTVDERARVRVFNAAAGALFDVDRARALGRAIIEVIPSVDLERMVEDALAARPGSRDVILGRGTRERYVGITAQPYESGAIVIAADRTALLAAEKMRSDFIGNVSHELRTPLSAMAGWVHLIETGKLDEAGLKRAASRLRGNIDDQVKTIERFLGATRQEGRG
jgi:two-component system, OmpR family, phosphate regulon sensor histidine kinase PhoR